MANPTPGHPYPNLQTYPDSGLTFPWAEIESFDMSAGHDGVRLGMAMLIYWEDLNDALTQLLGFTQRGSNGGLERHLPWQHPRFTQLVVKNIVRVRGLRSEGKEFAPFVEAASIEGFGIGVPANLGPAMAHNCAELTLQFWRPPYAVRSDEDIVDGNGSPQEWLRYVDRRWTFNSQIVAREGSHLQWGSDMNGTGSPGDGYSPPAASNNRIASPLGKAVTHSKVSRRWYEIPEASIFTAAQDLTPTGQPENFLYTQTATTNPITSRIYPSGSPIVFCVNAPIGGDPWNGGGKDVDNLDLVAANRLFGAKMGTMLFERAEIEPRELQLPPGLMNIPVFANNEAVSQVQYDIVLHFDLFDPPVGVGVNGDVPWFGHNLVPSANDLLYYPAISVNTIHGTTTFVTLFEYADLSDLFSLL